ncbi:hypothetical protein UFOVP520_31 [uncultured Caudovirales phage]|jgi:hypothetical protein|uniref:Uncharacterized protein n=1 Tax=uncultured Caudovirales phage TaxID=2100421 RepID=A0A6J5MPF9_9CAUD|nr:hypothetical protein UFOVP520_31 [uncultured Caudovirales phage]
MKPDERARVIYINCLYYTKEKAMAIQCALYMVQMIIEQKLKIDDKIYWKLVKEEIYLIEI